MVDYTDEVSRLEARIKALQVRKAKVLENALHKEWSCLVARFRAADLPLPNEAPRHAGPRPMPGKHVPHKPPGSYDKELSKVQLSDQFVMRELKATHPILTRSGPYTVFVRKLHRLGYQPVKGKRGHWEKVL